MRDQTGRNIDYIRISITDRCNLRCVYCMPAEGVKAIPHDEILTYDEIERICSCMAQMGVKKIKVTGGEPLVRRSCNVLVAKLKAIPGIEKVTLTTNGILLKEQMADLAAAGIDAINVSLDTLDREQYAQVTRRDRLEDVLAGIDEVLQYPQVALKINCVPIMTQEENLVTLAGIAREHPIHVRFIEVMPIGYGRQFTFCGEEQIKEILERAYGPMTPYDGVLGNGPSHYYSLEGFAGKIGFVSSISHKFCEQCNRVRLTAEGFLKTCLQYDTGHDLRKMMREGCDDEALKAVIGDAVWHKPLSHHFLEEQADETDRQAGVEDELRGMSQIGG